MFALFFLTTLSAATLDYSALPQLLKSNGEWTKSLALLEGAQAKRGFLKRSFLPVLNARAGRESFTLGPGPARTQNYATLEANVNIYNGGRDRYADEMREASFIAHQASSDDVHRRVLGRTRDLWNAWRHHHEAVAILKMALENNEAHIKAADRRVRAGLATQADTLDFQQYHLELEQTLAREEEEVHDHGRLLMAVLGLTEPPTLPEAPQHQHDDKLLSEPFAPSAHPRARSTAAEGLALQGATARGERWYMPRVDVYGALTHYTDRQQFFDTRSQRDDMAVGAMLTLPLFDGGEARREAQAFASARRGEALYAAQLQRELMAEHEKALVHVKLTHNLLHKASQSVDVAERYLKMTLAEYQRGVKMSPDLREAAYRFSHAKLLEAQTRWDHESARANLMALLGQ